MKTRYRLGKSFKDGYALLLSVVLLSAMIITTLAFARIFLNEIRTTAENRWSMQAIYAADTGIERALFHLYKDGANDTFNEENSIFVDSDDTYQVSITPQEDELVIHSYGTSNNILRELEINMPSSISFIKKEMEDDVFSSVSEDSCELTTTCNHPDVILSASSSNNSCHKRAYYTDETFDPEKVYFFQQESQSYGDCQIGDGLDVGTISLLQDLTTQTPYYFAYRAFYTEQSDDENLVVSTSSGQGPFVSSETSFTGQENGFFTCIFSRPLSFSSSDDYIILKNTTASAALIVDWYAFYKKIPEGIPSCDDS